MTFIVKTVYVIGALLIGGYAYHWFGTFKRLSEFTCDEFNEDMNKEEHICESKALAARNFSYTVFVVSGLLIWAFVGTTMGKIAVDITHHNVLKWGVYIIVYLFLVRLPVGITSKAIVHLYEIKNMPEKRLFTMVALIFYLSAIFFYNYLPGILKWHLYFLN